MAATSMKDYLKRYEANPEEEKKKKKKKKKTKPDSTNILVVDEDPVWQKPVSLVEEEDADDSADEKPQIDEDIEVKRMKRLELVRSRRPYHALSEDGSGWVRVSDTTLKQPVSQDTDISPPRKRQARYDTPSPEPEERPVDISPPRRARRGSTKDTDISPPRKREARNDTPSPRREKMSTDISPHRRPQTQSSEDTRRKDSAVGDVNDMSPLRRPHRSHSGDLHNTSNDLSPPRKSKREPPVPPKSGLLTAKDVKEEIAKTKREDWLRFKKMDPSISGRGAEPVYRDKTGKRISKEELLKSEEEKKPKEEKKLEWGKGLAQKREAEERLRELELEKEKPFARTRDDPDLDRDLKERVRWGDPMAHLVKKKQPDLVLPNFGDNERMKESGFVVPQEVPKHSWIKRGLDSAPNRYGIRPGRHWDGVDRSTGYEKELFKRMNEKKATETEAYLWSVADM